jgi:hypothetical protein
MVKRLAIGLVLVLGAMLPAAAQDCGGETPLDAVICADPGLSARAPAMDRALATAMGGLGDSAAAEVAASQSAWWQHVADICLAPSEDNPVRCIGYQFDHRFDVLEGSVARGELRFYPTSAYASLPDPDAEPDSAWALARHSHVGVRIDGGAEADGFNAAMAALDTELEAFLGAAGDGTPDMDGPSSDTNVRIAIAAVEGDRISLDLTADWYGHGAAHGSFVIEQVHYLRDHEREMEAADVFAAKRWQQQLAAMVHEALSDEGLIAEGWIGGPEDLVPMVTDPRRWRFEADRLVVQFQIYEIGPYAGGAPSIGVGWPALEPLLAEGAWRYVSVY